MASDILVTGGTGTLGSRLVPRLVAAGRDVRVLTRHARADEKGVTYAVGDLATGEGVAAAVADVDVVVHCAGTGKDDVPTTRALVRALTEAGRSPHLVFISVVGADQIPVVSAADRAMFGYFGMKFAAERIVTASGLPWTTLRATQFHDLVLTVAKGLAKLPVVPLPSGYRFQPVETDEVAARLAELALAEPAGLVPDVAGPKVCGVDELMRAYLSAVGRRRPIVPVPLPGGAARAVRNGAVLNPDRAVGVRTWEEFLAERVGRPATTARP
ncbi:MAG TPA: NAD(P)H-binding protein [Actinocatenispora sp.]